MSRIGISYAFLRFWNLESCLGRKTLYTLGYFRILYFNYHEILFGIWNLCQKLYLVQKFSWCPTPRAPSNNRGRTEPSLAAGVRSKKVGLGKLNTKNKNSIIYKSVPVPVPAFTLKIPVPVPVPTLPRPVCAHIAIATPYKLYILTV